jgi:hypothetical protein
VRPTDQQFHDLDDVGKRDPVKSKNWNISKTFTPGNGAMGMSTWSGLTT